MRTPPNSGRISSSTPMARRLVSSASDRATGPHRTGIASGHRTASSGNWVVWAAPLSTSSVTVHGRIPMCSPATAVPTPPCTTPPIASPSPTANSFRISSGWKRPCRSSLPRWGPRRRSSSEAAKAWGCRCNDHGTRLAQPFGRSRTVFCTQPEMPAAQQIPTFSSTRRRLVAHSVATVFRAATNQPAHPGTSSPADPPTTVTFRLASPPMRFAGAASPWSCVRSHSSSRFTQRSAADVSAPPE